METIELCIIEDNDSIRKSLETYLEKHPAIEIKLIASSVEGFIEKYDAFRAIDINLVILDIGLPGMSGLEGIKHIQKRAPKADIVMLTTYDDEETIFKALCAGACSYIAKSTPLPKIQEGLFIIRRGGSYMSPGIARKIATHFMPKQKRKEDELTPRQKQIVEALVEGLSYKLIADKLSISIDTVRDHIKRIYRVLEVHSKAEVIRKSLQGDI